LAAPHSRHPATRRGAGAGAQEREVKMADKGKGKDSGKVKKQKAAKVGKRPHEQRQEGGLVKKTPA